MQALLSGAAYYVMGLVVKKKGPVFYSAFNPLATLLVAILGSFFLHEQLYTGRYECFTAPMYMFPLLYFTAVMFSLNYVFTYMFSLHFYCGVG